MKDFDWEKSIERKCEEDEWIEEEDEDEENVEDEDEELDEEEEIDESEDKLEFYHRKYQEREWERHQKYLESHPPREKGTWWE